MPSRTCRQLTTVAQVNPGRAVRLCDVLVALGNRIGDEMGELELPISSLLGAVTQDTRVAAV